MQKTYTMPAALNAPTNRYNVAANLALFLVENGLTIFDDWKGKMSYADQRALCGVALGKGTIHVDGENDRIFCMVTICFGQDWQYSGYIDCHSGDVANWHTGEPSEEMKKLRETF
jgi:hypothetical protein